MSSETSEWIPSEEPGAGPGDGFLVITRTSMLVGTVAY